MGGINHKNNLLKTLVGRYTAIGVSTEEDKVRRPFRCCGTVSNFRGNKKRWNRVFG
jgi:hypothetical protein